MGFVLRVEMNLNQKEVGNGRLWRALRKGTESFSAGGIQLHRGRSQDVDAGRGRSRGLQSQPSPFSLINRHFPATKSSP